MKRINARIFVPAVQAIASPQQDATMVRYTVEVGADG
jgi:hypothetical protein